MVEKNAGVKEAGDRKKFNYKSSKTQFIPAKISFFACVGQANFIQQLNKLFPQLFQLHILQCIFFMAILCQQ